MVANIDLTGTLDSSETNHIRHRRCVKVYSSDDVKKVYPKKSVKIKPISREKISPFERAEYDEYVGMSKSERALKVKQLKNEVDSCRLESIRLHSDLVTCQNPFAKAGII